MECLFEDGGVTPYNNPAHLLFLKTTLPEYRLQWPTGTENLHLVSVGTGHLKHGRPNLAEPHLLETATNLPIALIQSYQQNQDLLCRLQGQTLFGAPIDSELGDLIRPHDNPAFTYVRYNHLFTNDDFQAFTGTVPTNLPIDNLDTIPFLTQFGQEYALGNVQLAHLR